MCSNLEVKRCPLVYLIRIWITGWLDFPGGVWKQVSLDEVIACHSSLSPPPASHALKAERQKPIFKKKKKHDMIVCLFFWRTSVSVYVRKTQKGARVCTSCLRLHVCRHVGVDMCAGISSAHTRGLIMTLPKWAVCSDTPLAESHSGQT